VIIIAGGHPEETGFTLLSPYIPLGQVRQCSSKIVHAWTFEGDADPVAMKRNLFELEWPPSPVARSRSRKRIARRFLMWRRRG